VLNEKGIRKEEKRKSENVYGPNVKGSPHLFWRRAPLGEGGRIRGTFSRRKKEKEKRRSVEWFSQGEGSY